MIPDTWRPAVTDLAVLVPIILGLATIAVAVSRWHVHWLRGQIVAMLDARLGPIGDQVSSIDRAVNHQPPGAAPLVAQVQGLARAVEDLTVAGWRRAERVEELARLITDLAVTVHDLSAHIREEPPHE